MKETRRPKRRKRDRQGNRMALIGIVFVIFSMALVVNARSSSLRAKDLEYQVREENLRAQVEEEKKRAEDLGLCPDKAVYLESCQREAGISKPGRDHFKSRQLGIFSLLTEYNADERLCP